MIPHTPGPWFVHDFADPAVSSDPGPEDVTVSCDHPATITVASMGRAMTATLDEARANARLIAAAPDMLEAVKASLALGSKVYHNANAHEAVLDWGAVRKMLVAAIAKAEGP